MPRQAPQSSPVQHWMQKHSSRMKRMTPIRAMVTPLAGTISCVAGEAGTISVAVEAMVLFEVALFGAAHWIGPAAVGSIVVQKQK